MGKLDLEDRAVAGVAVLGEDDRTAVDRERDPAAGQHWGAGPHAEEPGVGALGGARGDRHLAAGQRRAVPREQVVERGVLHVGARERGATNVETKWADAHALPFPDATFDIVTCRIAPHHFDDLDASLVEVARVLKPGGRYVLEDSVAPDDADAARFLHEVEVARDSTHLRTLTAVQWVTALERAGLTVEHSEFFRKRRGFESWLTRGDCDDAGADAVRGRFGAFGILGPVTVWQVGCACSAGRLLSPGWPPRDGGNTSNTSRL